MACTFVEQWKRSGSIDSSFIRKYKRVFHAYTDDPGYGPLYVRQQLAAQLGITLGILSNYQTTGAHPENDTFSQVVRIDVDENNTDGKGWDVTVQYDAWNPDTMASNPLDLPPALSVEGQVFQQVTDVDIHGNPLINTAGDPYDPGILIDRQRIVVRIQQNLPTFPTFAFAYVDYLNSQPFCGQPAKTLKLAPPQVQRLFHPACQRYYDCAFVFDGNPNGWQANPLNQGFRQLVGGQQVMITDKNGQPITSPLPLNSAGAVLAIPATASSLITNEYDVYPTVDFNTVFNFGTIP